MKGSVFSEVLFFGSRYFKSQLSLYENGFTYHHTIELVVPYFFRQEFLSYLTVSQVAAFP